MSTITPKYPPGPRAWPLLGNLPFLLTASGELYEVGVSLQKQYGDIVRLRTGSTNIILVMGHEKFRELAMNDRLQRRPTNIFHVNYLFKERGVFFGNGEQHDRLKELACRAFQGTGVGTRTLEERIQEEAQAMCDKIASYGGQAQNLTPLYRQAVINVIASLSYGNRYEYEDPGLAIHVETMKKLALIFSSRQIENVMNCLVNCPCSKVGQAASAMFELEVHVQQKIADHRLTFDGDNIRDFIDLCLQMEGEEEHLSGNVFQLILDFYIGGTDTTMAFYIWSVVYLITRPEIQTRCRQEVQQVVGTGRVSLSDKDKMPYLQAFIYEVLRITSIASYTAPHSPQEDIQIDGLTIPKDSYVLLNVYAVGRDPDVWEKPEEFRPERFLSESGELLPLKDEFVQFGIGSRSCLGRHLVLMEGFIFLGTLVQRFELKPPPNTKPPSTTMGIIGFTPQPPPYKVCAMPL